jgi:hypothetical protein
MGQKFFPSGQIVDTSFQNLNVIYNLHHLEMVESQYYRRGR